MVFYCMKFKNLDQNVEQIATEFGTNPKNEENLEEQPKKQDKCRRYRKCDENCVKILNFKWGLRLLEALQEVTKNPLLRYQTQLAIMKFETCDSCDPINYPSCKKKDDCDDNIKLLRLLQPHSSKIRNLLRVIYKIREMNLWLINCNGAMENGDYYALKRLLTEANYCDNVESCLLESENNDENMDELVESKFPGMVEAFRKKCYEYPNRSCEVCNVRFYCKSENGNGHLLKETGALKEIKEKIKAKRLSEDPLLTLREISNCFAENLVENISSDLNSVQDLNSLNELPLEYNLDVQSDNIEFVCNQCKVRINKNQIPPFAFFNSMDFPEIPEEIKCLNSFELSLIKVAKTFQTVVRLTPLSGRGPAVEHIQALKGMAVHLPLPLEETLKYVDNNAIKLPSSENINIIVEGKILVDSMPTAKNKVWRSVVDIKKVYAALKKLKV